MSSEAAVNMFPEEQQWQRHAHAKATLEHAACLWVGWLHSMGVASGGLATADTLAVHAPKQVTSSMLTVKM